MIHQFYKYTIDLEHYQEQEVSQAIIPYEKRFEKPLSTEIKRFQREFHWSEMWKISDVRKRLKAGYKFWIFRPKLRVKGWIWLAPDGELKNTYVSKWYRNQGWNRHLTFAAMNEALNQDLDQVYFRVDIWNEISKHCVERIIETVGCKSNISKVIEEYE